MNAILVISGITLVFIGIGEINRLATMSTMPFLITYGVIEYSYFVLCMQFDINQVNNPGLFEHQCLYSSRVNY